MMPWRKQKYLSLLISTLVLLILIYISSWGVGLQQQTILNQKHDGSKIRHGLTAGSFPEELRYDQEYDLSHCKKKRILIYTGLFGKKIWPNIPEDYNFTELDGSPCPVSHCEITYNHAQMQSSDVVLAHGRDLPSAKDMHQIKAATGKPDQIWIYFIHESPKHMYYNVAEYNGLFNWTASYRTASEVFIPYYSISTRKRGKAILSQVNFAAGKDKMVLYISSHCDEIRLLFIKTLQKWIPVDVYGTCSIHIHNEHRSCIKDSDACKQLQKRYRFYLAFENSFCIDYITEKYFKNSLLQGLVPIVVGGANYSNSKLAVPNSFIDVSSFNTMESLSHHLLFLKDNSEAYNSYFQWRQEYQIELKHGMCKLCTALWDESVLKPRKTVDLMEFWGAEGNCYNAREKLDRLLA